jgi:hypothetical protein
MPNVESVIIFFERRKKTWHFIVLQMSLKRATSSE